MLCITSYPREDSGETTKSLTFRIPSSSSGPTAPHLWWDTPLTRVLDITFQLTNIRAMARESRVTLSVRSFHRLPKHPHLNQPPTAQSTTINHNASLTKALIGFPCYTSRGPASRGSKDWGVREVEEVVGVCGKDLYTIKIFHRLCNFYKTTVTLPLPGMLDVGCGREWYADCQTSDDRPDCQPDGNCCARKIFAARRDFKEQKERLQEDAEASGHEVPFHPKSHCELNPTEPYWC